MLVMIQQLFRIFSDISLRECQSITRTTEKYQLARAKGEVENKKKYKQFICQLCKYIL